MRHLVNISATADLPQTLADLALLGAVTPTGTTPRRVEVEAPQAWSVFIMEVIGVASCCCESDATVRLDLINITSGFDGVAHKPAVLLSGPAPGATWRSNRRRIVNGGTFAQRPSGRLKADAGRHNFTYSATNRLDGGHVNG